MNKKIKISRRMYNLKKNIYKKKYNIDEALTLLKKNSTVNFIESVDIAINLNIDTKKSEQNLRSFTILPYGIGKIIKVAVFADGKLADEAISAGADIVGTKILFNQIKAENINFDILFSPPEFIDEISKLGNILGPKGLMPNIKYGTITNNIIKSIKNAKIGQINFRNDKNGIIHTKIGKTNFSVENLKNNLNHFLMVIKKIRPKKIKENTYIKKISISTTMGNSICIYKSNLN